MLGRTAPPSVTSTAGRFPAITAGYLCGSAGLYAVMDYADHEATRLFFPPAGAAFGYLAIVGPRGLPAVLLAGVIGSLIHDPAALAADPLGAAVRNVVLALGLWLAVAALRRACRFQATFAALAWFVICGIVAAPVLTATAEAALTWLEGGPIDYGSWARTVVGEATAIGTLAPAAMMLTAGPTLRRTLVLQAPPRARLEAAAQALAIMVAPVLLVISRDLRVGELPLLPLTLVPVLWAAVGPDLSHSGLCLAATALGIGAGAQLRFGESEELYHSQVLMLASAMATLYVGVRLITGTRTRDTAELAARQWSALVAAAPATVARVGLDGAWRIEPDGARDGQDHVNVVSRATEVPELALAVSATQQRTVHWRVPEEPHRRFVTHVTPLPGGEVLTVTTETTRARTAEAELAWERTHDRETDLPNRELLLATADRALVEDAATSLIVVDVDQLSRGAALVEADPNALLLLVAERIRTALGGAPGTGEESLVARLGDDQFGVLVPSELTFARRQAERVQAVLDGPLRIDGHRVPFSAFVGVAAGDHERGAKESLRQAAMAMQAAREAGRSGVVVFDGLTVSSAAERARLASEVVSAVEHGELDLVFQPDVELANGRLTGVEALVRWRRRQGYAGGTELLVRLAEESGAAPDLDAWVMEESLRQLGAWRRRLDAQHVELGLNVSALSLSTDLPARLWDACRRHGVPPSHVRLEVTETALGDDGDAVSVLMQIRSMGCRIALDDFGTGYASLARLHRLPIDVLKLDRSFLPALTADKASQALVSLVLGLAEPLDLEVLAEGVETAAQRDLLIALGCRRAQGFLFSRPAPAGAIAREWLSDGLVAGFA